MPESQIQERAAATTQERNDGGVGQVVAREEEASSVGTGPTYFLGGVCVFLWE